jgi:hypothetical protein
MADVALFQAPLLVAAGSAKGKIAVWDASTEDAVQKYLASGRF